MRLKLAFFSFLFAFSLGIFHVNGQEFRKGPIIICPADPNSYDTYVPLRKELMHLKEQAQQRAEATAFKSNIIVNYNGFTDEAKQAFQYAVDIWASLLPSDVDIVVNANFEDLGSGVLGAASSAFFVRDFKNAPSDTTFYPIALAEKIAGKQLNLPTEPEINCSFSSTFNFYFGLDGDPPAGQYDFVSIVLHELGHGLGFAGVEGHSDTEGTWDYFNNKTARYNEFVELGNGTRFISLPNNSTETRDAITSNDLYFNGTLSVSVLSERPKLYAPSTYNGGSSFSHLDESEYPAGNPHSLMSPQFGAGEAIHDPGVALDIFADMGWFISVLDHEVDKRVVDNLTDDIPVLVTLRSDTTITSNNLRVVYSTDDFQTSSQLNLTETTPNVFTATIPNPGSEGTLKYYFEGVSDGLGRDLRSPMVSGKYHEVLIKQVPQITVNSGQNLWDFESDDGGFFEVSLEGNTQGLWERGTPGNVLTSSSTPTNVWKTGLSTNVGYSGISNRNALTTPYFDLSDVSANYLMKFELGMDLGEVDGDPFETGPLGVNVEYSIDRGKTWEVLGEKLDQAGENWYNFQNNGGGTFSTNVFDNEPGWIIDSVNAAVPVVYNISRLAGNTHVGFRIVFHSEADFLEEGYDADGVLIDNFEIEKGTPTADFIVKNASALVFPGQEVAFEYISNGATSFLWNFGDGNTSTERNPVHSYAAGGKYTVSLSIDNGADVVTKNDLILVIASKGSNYTLADGGDFEVDNGDFIIENISGTGFERGKSDIAGKDGTASGDFAYVTGIDEATYADRSEAFLYTPIFDFTSLGVYTLSFKANYKTETGWDGFIIEYSKDNGETWEQLKAEVASDWYDMIGEDNPEQGWPAIPLFTGNSNGYVTKTVDISELGGLGEVVFRFHWLSDYASVDVGVAIDDFELSGPEQGAAVAEFSFENVTGCDGQVVTFYNESTGTITSMEWDFGANASPATASGIGPHEVTYSGTGSSTVKLTVTSPINGTVVEEKVDVISTSPDHEPSITRTYNGDGTYTLQASPGDAYQWFRNGEPIEGATNQTLIVDLGDGGEFTALISIGSCAKEAQGLIVNSVFEKYLHLYPNPASDFIYLASDIQLNGDYALFDLSGRLVKKGSMDGKEISLDLSDIREGVYMLQLNVNDEKISKQIIKK